MRAWQFLGMLPVVMTGCANEGAIGETCETPAAEEECVEGGVCEETANGSTLCLALCESQADCADDENCNGLSDGSDGKACHPVDQQ